MSTIPEVQRLFRQLSTPGHFVNSELRDSVDGEGGALLTLEVFSSLDPHGTRPPFDQRIDRRSFSVPYESGGRLVRAPNDREYYPRDLAIARACSELAALLVNEIAKRNEPPPSAPQPVDERPKSSRPAAFRPPKMNTDGTPIEHTSKRK